MDLENICCWENIQFAMLCLNDDAFEIFLMTNEEIKNMQQNKKYKNQEIEENIVRDKNNNIKTGDKTLDEIEKAFNSGNKEDLQAMLKILEDM
jgi:hypothetical protein